MNKFSKELLESMTEACEHAEGKPGRVRVSVVDVPDVRAIRRRLRMSQMEFARAYRTVSTFGELLKSFACVKGPLDFEVVRSSQALFEVTPERGKSQS